MKTLQWFREPSTRGTNKAYKFATLNVVEKGRRFTLAVIPISPFDLLEQTLEKLIRIAKSKVKIRYAYMDRAFFNVAYISKLEELESITSFPQSRMRE